MAIALTLLASAGGGVADAGVADLLRAIADVKTQWSVAAFAIAAIIVLFSRFIGAAAENKVLRATALAFAGVIAAVGMTPILVSAYVDSKRIDSEAIYRVRITVVGPQQVPVDEANVWSSFGGEAKRVAGGWQIDIPTASKPTSGKLTIFAAQATAFLNGRQDVELANDRNPAVTIELKRDTATQVSGMVRDTRGAALLGARVMVVGHGEEMQVTSASGGFVLPAHAAVGQQVLIHAEKDGYEPVDQWHPAGASPAVLSLRKK